MTSNKALLGATAIALTLIAVLALGLGPKAESQEIAPSQNPPRTITVVGTGTVNLVPDLAQVNVGAEARAGSVSEAKAEVDGKMVAIHAALQEMGIEDKDIQTSHYSIYFEREPMQPMLEGPVEESQGGYRVSNLLRVTVRDVEMAGDVLDAAVEAGANQVHGVTFTVADESRWQGQAREVAMSDARTRAAELAGLAAVELAAVQSVSEVIGGWPAGMSPAPERVMGGGFAPGEMEMSTRVQVTFAIQ
jgi:uncharacterized protein YggE